MRLANRAFVAGGAGFAMAVLAGCGSNGSLLSAGQAGALTDQLNRISQELSAGNCQQAASSIQSFQGAVASLGSASVNETLINNLDQGASTIATLAQQRCPTGAGSSTTTPTTTTKTTKTKTTTTPTTTTTTPTTSSITTTVPTTTETVPTSTGTTTPTTTTSGTSTTGGAGIGSGG